MIACISISYDAGMDALLGKTADIAASELVSPHGVNSRRVQRFHLQNLAASLLPKERVAECLRRAAPGAERICVLHRPAVTGAQSRFHGLVVCDRVWFCPICAARITERRRRELTLAAAREDLSPLLLTFTLRHNKRDSLDRLLAALLEAIRAFKSGAWWQKFVQRYGVAGSIRSLEVTHGVNGWHPHCHMMLLVYGAVPPDHLLEKLESEVKAHWLTVVERQGADADWWHGCDVRTADRDVQDYIAKFGREPQDMGWTPEHELTKAHVKRAGKDGRSPFQLLADYGAGDQDSGALFQEYARVFKGRNQLVWSRGLRDLLGLGEELPVPAAVDDLRQAVEAAEYHVLAEMTRVQWGLIVKQYARSSVLDVADLGDPVLLYGWIDHLLSGYRITRVDLSRLMGRPDQVRQYLEELGIGNHAINDNLGGNGWGACGNRPP